MVKKLITIAMIGTMAISSPINQECLNYKLTHRTEHFDRTSTIDSLSKEHRKFSNCLSDENIWKYNSLLDNIEMILSKRQHRHISMDDFAMRRHFSCLYKLRTNYVPSLNKYLQYCVYNKPIYFK